MSSLSKVILIKRGYSNLHNKIKTMGLTLGIGLEIK